MHTIDPEIRDQAYQYFSQEALEFLQIIEEGLLNLQAEHETPQIHSLMRAAHSIKGGAASIGLPAIERISHRLEDIFRALYRQDLEIDRDIEEILLQAYDCLRSPLVEQIQTGKHDVEAAIEKAEPIFAVIESLFGDNFNADVELPTSAELGFDIAQVVFSSDVAQGLDRLQAILNSPEKEQVSGEIRAQAEVFSGIGELLNLPGFSEIAQQTLLALDTHPNEPVLVGQVAIDNFKEAQEAVLAGDRDRGGVPSEALLMLASASAIAENLASTFDLGGEDDLSSSALEDVFKAVLTEEITESTHGFFEDIPEEITESTHGFFEEIPEEITESTHGFFEEIPEEPTESTRGFFEDVLEDMLEESPESTHGFFEDVLEDMLEESPESAAGFFEEIPVTAISQPILEPTDKLIAEVPSESSNGFQDGSDRADDLPWDIEIENPVRQETGIETNYELESIVESLEEENDFEEIEVIEITSVTSDSESDLDTGLDFSALESVFGDSEDTEESEALDLSAFILSDQNVQDLEIANQAQILKDTSAETPTQLVPNQIIEPVASTEQNKPVEEKFISLDQLAQKLPTIPSLTEEQDTDLKIETLLKQGSSKPDTPANSLIANQVKAKSTTKQEEQAQSVPTPQMSEAIRVDLSRLERLNNLAGELVTQENSSSLQSQQLQGMLLNLQRRSDHFEELTKKLQSWIDSSQKTEVRSQKPVTGGEQISTSLSMLPELATFDPLLMDSYSYIYTLVQESVEEMAQMGETIRDMDLLAMQAQNTQRKKQQTLKQLRNDLLWARMMPLNEILSRFPRMVRDLSTKYGKQVKLSISGGATLVDKAMLEKLYDPLVHLIRNAFDHGTEPSNVRVKQGKSSEATIEVRAYHRGNQTFVEIRDDGRGIDPEKVRAAAIAKGILSPTDATSQAQIYEFLFSPSFSTAEKVSEISGRGVGLTSVREQIIKLKGSVTIDSELGKGTVFTIRLPLTLTTAKLLVFSVGVNLMAIPVDTLLSIVTAGEDQIQTIQGQQFYRYQDELIPMYPQSAFDHRYPLPKNSEEQIRSMSLPIANKTPLLIISAGNQFLALEVDQIFNEQELVIKPFGKAIAPPPYLYGCTILGDGSLVPVVDGSALIAKWLKHSGEVYAQPSIPAELESISSVTDSEQDLNKVTIPPSDTTYSPSVPTILVIDDSLTARQTLALTLKKSGYRVVQAIDGRDALEKIRLEPNIKAAFCDVEMPRMNGFEFLNQFRHEHPQSTMPIVMLTSRGGEKHRSLAKLFGASGYLTKPYLEHELLKTLEANLKQLVLS
ncbi:response regulator [Tumidithrix elongata RA019]|uniref:histidine kinase n=1 Tax=Tumidithrix elongata BACA0141 TaxID=2716417 RepID=A0AAW9PYP3_9CYAN|nr:response regulator [Tumidithrix elongata RA019]